MAYCFSTTSGAYLDVTVPHECEAGLTYCWGRGHDITYRHINPQVAWSHTTNEYLIGDPEAFRVYLNSNRFKILESGTVGEMGRANEITLWAHPARASIDSRLFDAKMAYRSNTKRVFYPGDEIDTKELESQGYRIEPYPWKYNFRIEEGRIKPLLVIRRNLERPEGFWNSVFKWS